MGIWKKLFGRGGGGDSGAAPGAGEHALLLKIKLADDHFGSDQDREELLYRLQDELEAAVAKVGEFDGDEWGEGFCTIYIYGPDAEALWEAAAPVLEKRPFRAGSIATKRFGPPETGRTETVNLHWDG